MIVSVRKLAGPLFTVVNLESVASPVGSPPAAELTLVDELLDIVCSHIWSSIEFVLCVLGSHK